MKVQATGVALQVRYGYTLADRLAWVIYPDGTRVDYGRDGNGEISVADFTRPGSATKGLVSSVSYHPCGPASTIKSSGWERDGDSARAVSWQRTG